MNKAILSTNTSAPLPQIVRFLSERVDSCYSSRWMARLLIACVAVGTSLVSYAATSYRGRVQYQTGEILSKQTGPDLCKALLFIALCCLHDGAKATYWLEMEPIAFVYSYFNGEAWLDDLGRIVPSLPRWDIAFSPPTQSICNINGASYTVENVHPFETPDGSFAGLGWTCRSVSNPAYSFTTRAFYNGLCPPGYLGYVNPITGVGYVSCAVDSNKPNRFKNSGAPACNMTDGTNPINIGIGNKYQAELDYQTAGQVLPLRFERFYNSDIFSGGIQKANWRHTYDRTITLLRSGNSRVSLRRQDNKAHTFSIVDNSWQPDSDISDRLAEIKGAADARIGWIYYNAASNETERYDSVGKLLSIQHKNGVAQTLTYSDGSAGANGGFVLDATGNPTVSVLPADLLIRVTDLNGRSLQFGYDASSRVVKLIDPAGGVIIYTYNASDNLSTVTYPDGKVRTYYYEDSRFPNNLTGITDENGVRFATYGYDGSGRAISSEHSGGADRHTLTFGTNQTTVTDPLGTSRTYAFQTLLGVVKNTGVSQPGGSGCSAASSNIQYDANGNVASRTDFNGNVTTYTYDLSRNLETSRVEASGKPESRTISTQWHGVWRLPVKVAEPKKVTTWVYNGDVDPATGSVLSCAPAGAVVPSISGGTVPIGVLCKKVEQATGDLSGASGFGASVSGTPRIWSWTYNPYGQVLTADGPRTDVADVTAYAYYDATDPCLGCRGNVASITNALGQVTRITAYDGSGRPLTIVDPNGLSTTLAYDARGRLTSRNVGGESTAYQYDGVGSLTRVTLPDGGYLAYTYDAAHRLTGIGDSLGNRIAYTLDAAGNRTREDVFDPASTLVKTQSRVYDALGRLQQLIDPQ